MNDQNEQRGRVGAEGPASPAAPTISLPRGGGAIQGIGEKFAANPMTGTASMTVPLALSPGRSGFGPKLSLSYDSGSGNGPFGIGWSLDLPAITRKTDKGLPTYSDAEESDVYVLSGAEDLAPVLESGGQRHEDAVSVPDVTIHRYRPRTEGLFARIERWTHRPSGEIHWRSISRDNVTTVYGKTAASRVSDPEDPLRMFSWRICEAFDDKGNASIYEYVAEDGANVDRAVTHERNRQRTANRYLKRILYGNRTSRLVEPDLTTTDWLFEVVFDYGEGHYEALALDPNLSVAEQHRFVRATSGAAGSWAIRPDPSSSYRAGFEVRTYRRCQRVLMFHRFPELGSDPHLVRSTAFEYDDLPALEGEVPVPAEVELAHPGSTRFASFLRAVSQSGYVRNEPRSEAAGATIYLKKSLPPVEFEYSRAQIDDRLHTIDRESLENLPIGLDGTAYQWVDLDGEGVSGILTEQADAWFYKSNLGNGQFAPARPVSPKPSLADLRGGRQRLLDLSGDGHLDVVTFADPAPGLYSRTSEEGWESFRAFRQLPNVAWDEPELRFIDLDGDGHADVLMSEDDVFTWYPSLAEKGFGPPRRVPLPTDEERGPRLVFADGAQTIYLADLGGDGLTDLVRIKNGEVCYWPNLGYGRFGAKVTMDNGPWFDSPDQFEHRRLRLADIDGSGTQDLLYLGRDGVRLYFNQSGNRWSGPHTLEQFPPVDSISSVRTADLLGNGTASLVWSSALPGDSPSPLRYIDLMGGTKPHLLTGVSNNLGAETRVEYAPSTKFYLADKKAGRPWITNVPFPVHVVERVVTYDHVSGNRFAARYTYHHGYFDGVEREFRGFGLVEQLDTEEFATLNDGQVPATNIDAASHVPPVLTRTWFHTGIYLGRDRVSNFFAGLPGGGGPHTYYREPGMTEDEAQAALLEDTILPTGLTVEEEREACRALRGSMLRQEVYALDGSSEEGHPYTVTEQNFGIRVIQRREGNRHGIFFTHPRETVHHHQERDPTDPRIHHALVLEVDDYGNVLQEMTVGYGRRAASTDPVLTAADRARQDRSLITWTQHHVTNAIDAGDQYRTPLPAETLTWELTGFAPEGGAERFSFDEWTRANFARLTTATEIPYEQTADHVTPERRLIEHVRTLYRRDDLTALLALRTLEPLALPGESYRLSLTPGLLARVFQRRRSGEPDENLLPDPAPLLEGRGADQGGYVAMDRNWWIPSGRLFFHPTANTANEALTAAAERDAAQQHFFVPRKVVDAFAQATLLDHEHDLFAVRTVDPLGNTVTAAYDHRVLQPQLVTDPNGNRTTAAFDALGMVVATATLGKVGESLGDLLEDFAADLTLAEIQDYVADPHGRATVLLGKASTCTVYDLHRFRRTRQPAFAASLVRETHFHDPLPAHGARTQIGFSYSDGFGREIQQKTMAEAGDAPERLAPVGLPGGDLRPGDLVRDAENRPILAPAPRRWVGTGRTVFNNKGQPVRQYEPFFSATHLYEGEQEMTDTGVSPVLFYDPVQRVVATLHPNHTYEKVVYGVWRQATYDSNDTVAASGSETGDPRTDPDIAGYVREYFAALPPTWQTWHAERISDPANIAEFEAAQKAVAHANTPTVAHFDALGRPFLTVADNGTEVLSARVELNIEGNQQVVRDPVVQGGDTLGRIVMRYQYDMLGNVIHRASMEAGEQWVLGDVLGNPVRRWDSRLFLRRMSYDPLRRPTRLHATEAGVERLAGETIYGESQGDAGNHRTRVHQVFDGAGVVTHEGYDFKGNLIQSHRRFLVDYKTQIDWNGSPALEGGLPYTNSTTYDAMNRPLTATSPDGSVYRPTFNEANLLEKVDVHLRASPSATAFVTDIDYNAKGQRERIVYANGVETNYEYDPATFRLQHLTSTRPTSPDATASALFEHVGVVQDLHYTFDPVGNVTRIEDAALRTTFNSQQIDAAGSYTYDPLYRLIEARGREHIGQEAFDFSPRDSRRDFPFTGWSAHPHDLQALRNYVRHYEYDAVGNFEQVRHIAAGGGWTRRYEYGEDSLTEAGKKNNRLTRTIIGNGFTQVEPYLHDEHGNMTSMPHTGSMTWDFQDRLERIDLGGGGTAFYVYDAEGQRVRKVIESAAGTRRKERRYLGVYEIYREYNGTGNGVEHERESLHVLDHARRIVLVETQTVAGGSPTTPPVPLVRYQLGNHLDSASLEFDHTGALISYEEYHPYGTTAFQAGRSTAEVSAKRYRYTGKERDDESGFNYHGARYYAPWLGRWTAADAHLDRYPSWSPYCYGLVNPLRVIDPDGLDVLVVFRGGVTGDEEAIAPEDAGTAGELVLALQETAQEEGIELDTIIIEPGVASTGAVEAALEFIEENLEEGERLIVYGYSRGGDAAVDLADELVDTDTRVDLLFTVDAAYGPLSNTPVVSPVDREIPESVDVNINYYQTEASGPSGITRTGEESGSDSSERGGSSRSDSGSSDLIGSRGDPNEPTSRRTRVYNNEVTGVEHHSIDEDVQETVLRHARDFLTSERRGSLWNPQDAGEQAFYEPTILERLEQVWDDSTRRLGGIERALRRGWVPFSANPFPNF